MKQLRWAFALTSLLFGVAVMLFFALFYPHHLHFQEQYQLFLFEQNYVCEVLSLPGGLADLIGRFFTQFFLYAWFGAFFIAFLLVCLQLLTYCLLRTRHTEPLSFVLSFAPSVLCCCFLCDENALMSAPTALLLVVSTTILIEKIKADLLRQAIALISIPVIYQLAGAFALLYGLVLIIREIQKERTFQSLLCACLLLVVTLSTPAAWHHIINFDLKALYSGLHYYRDPAVFPLWAWLAACAIPLFILLPQRLRNWSPRHSVAVLLSGWTIILLAGGMIVKTKYSQSQEDTMAYDFMARNAMWNRIQQKAELHAPKNQVSAVALNLALAAKGMLCERMFEYPQNGLAGLLPNYATDCVSPLATSEAFYRLGMINTAQRFVFEAQEAIPDFQKSARCYKRLAETNLINGSYEVARKYLFALQKTIFYRDWATQTLNLIADDAAVASHPEYGYLRSIKSSEDYFFGGNELHQILIRQLQANPNNRMAFEYLEAACLLAKDLERVTEYYTLSEPMGYETIPSAIQQAMLLQWSQSHPASGAAPSYFQPAVVQGFKNFYSAMQVSNGNPETVKRSFGKTYWSYYFFHR